MRRALVIVLALAGLLVGAGSAAAASGDLRVGSPQDFETPNPFKAVEAIAVDSYESLYYDNLVNIKPSDQSVDYSGLAKSAVVSADGKTITFHLRTGITWSDGKPFTSADAVWTFNAVLKNKTNQLHSTIEAVKSVSAPDKDTFVLHLATRDSEFIAKLAIPILPAHIWSKYKTSQLDKTDGPIPTVTTAAYVLTHWEKLGTTIITRNDSYAVARNGGKLPDVKRILITYYANPDSIYRDVSQGHLDYGYDGPTSWARRSRTDKNPNVHLVSSPRGGYWEIAFNSCPKTGSPICSGPGKGVKTAVVQDPSIRKAMAYAIDREKLIPTVYDGQGVTAYSLISPRFKRYFVDRKNTALGYAFDPAKAQAQKLKAGGWNCAKTPCTKNGVKAAVRARHATRAREFQAMARRVKADAPRSGSSSTSTFMSDDALNNRIYASGTKKDLYAPELRRVPVGLGRERHDANADHGGAALEQLLERLVLRQQGLRQGADRRAHRDDAAGTLAAVRKAEAMELADLPYLPLVHLNAVALNRTDTWHGWLPSPSPNGRPLFEDQVMQQILALKPGPAPAAVTPGTSVATVDGRRRLADHAALGADRLDADLARDPRLVVHLQRAQEDRAARVD